MKHSAVLPRARRLISVTVAAVTLSLCATSAQALVDDDNSLIEGAKLCTRYLPRHEREYGIPVHLLAAIASTESGRYHRALGLNLPWPWTINVEGKGFFFDTKEQAIAAVRNFQARGFQSIDVGCMQVNLHHHPYAFANLDQAFDPAYNVAYAAQFLKQNFQDEGSWRKATADYHSHTPIYGEQYARLVYSAWSRIINKVADARAGRPILNTVKEPVVTYHDKAAEVAANNIIHKARSYHSPHLHELSVSADTTRENGVIVVRPEHIAAGGEQQASLDDKFITQAHDNTSAAAPSAADGTDKGAKVVKVQNGRVVGAKGQFSPESAHIIRVSDSATTSADNTSSGKSMFVFDN